MASSTSPVRPTACSGACAGWTSPPASSHTIQCFVLRVYVFGEAIHLFRLMQRKDIKHNVITYNTMISIYGKSMEHEKAGNLVSEMQQWGIQPNVITYSTVISIWGRAGKLDRAAMLFQKLRSAGVKMVLYQTMIVIDERAGMVAHAKRLLHDLKHPDNIPMETAITLLAKAGRVEEAACVFRCMINLFAKNKKHQNFIEVFDRMRAAGYFPESEMIGAVMNAYGKLQEYEMADALYREMQEEGYIF